MKKTDQAHREPFMRIQNATSYAQLKRFRNFCLNYIPVKTVKVITPIKDCEVQNIPSPKNLNFTPTIQFKSDFKIKKTFTSSPLSIDVYESLDASHGKEKKIFQTDCFENYAKSDEKDEMFPFSPRPFRNITPPVFNIRDNDTDPKENLNEELSDKIFKEEFSKIFRVDDGKNKNAFSSTPFKEESLPKDSDNTNLIPVKSSKSTQDITNPQSSSNNEENLSEPFKVKRVKVKSQSLHKASKKEKAEAIKYLYDAYYYKALNKAYKVSNEDNKVYLLSKAINPIYVALLLSKRKDSLKGNKEGTIKWINSLNVDSTQKEILLALSGYVDKDKYTQVSNYLLSKGYSSSQIKSITSKLKYLEE